MKNLISDLPEKGARPADIPANPRTVYRERGWKGWADWLASPQERQLLDHLTMGAKMPDIPNLMGLSRSATYTLRDRLRKKIKKNSSRV